MNTAWWLALGLALVLIVGVVVLLQRRGRGAVPPPSAQPPQPPVVQRTPPTQRAPRPGAPPPVGAGAEIEARRQASTDALRQARQRKAEEAERAAQARAEPVARRAAPPAAPPPAAPRAPAGWASRPMDLGPAEPATSRPMPAPIQRPPVALVPPVVPVAPVAPVAATAAATPAAVQPVHPLAPVQPLAPPAPSAPARVPVVLVADDSKVVRVKTGRLLEKQGWQVLLADDGTAALQLLDTHVPDLLITDVEMPGLDGFALTRQVRSHARCARLPVIMITSSDDRHRAEALAAGVDLLLGKPYAEETLLSQSRRLLGVTAPVLH